ncbi:MAG: fumarate hydratase [Acidobacteriia bacterium]|nr:fumarate hydratase [Terriglobia bacterium]
MSFFQESMLELITETSTNLPPDVRQAMTESLQTESPTNQASQALNVIATNIDIASQNKGPICQDTGMPTFEIKTPVGTNQLSFKEDIRQAIVKATRLGKLRPNSVDSLTGENSGDNLGPGTPIIHFEQWENDKEIEVKLILKGGGCENKNIQYSVPCELSHLGRADRNLDGVRKCILHAVWQAQGQGCSAGAIGVCIGGDRTSGYSHAKEQLFRTLDDTNPNSNLAKLENYVISAANTLGIGTMGFGGQVTLLGCKVGILNRLPASFFVSVAYDCWAFRRLGVVLDAETGDIKRWLYKTETPAIPVAVKEGFSITGQEVRLDVPISQEQVKQLKVGDLVLVNGEIYTGRDAVHMHLTKNDAPVELDGTVLYHCGPVVQKNNGKYLITAAGPTTSIREEPYQANIIKRFGIRAVMGKGGMGSKTLRGLQESGAVYLNAIGGAAQYYSRCIEEVLNVHLLEFGTPEAMWHLRVKDFPAIVTMDSHGNSLHADIEKSSGILLGKLADPVFD